MDTLFTSSEAVDY